MDVTVKQTEFLRAITRATAASDPKGAMPIVGMLRLRAQLGRGLTIEATDLVRSVTIVVRDVTIHKDGMVCLTARHLLEVVRVMPDGEVRLKIGKNFNATISASRRTFTLSGMPGEDFPTLPSVPDFDARIQTAHGTVDAWMSVPAKLLAAMIRTTSYAMSRDTTRPHLNALSIEFRRGAGDREEFTFNATDGHRIASATAAFANSLHAKVLLPAVMIPLLLALLEDALHVKDTSAPQSIRIALRCTSGVVAFHYGATTITTKPIDAAFPSVEQLLREAASSDKICQARVSRNGIIESVRSVALFCDDVVVSFAEGRAGFLASDKESGEGSDELSAEVVGEASFRMNARYLTESLSALTSREVKVEVQGGDSPVCITPVVDDEADALSSLHIIMPMRA